MTLLFIGITAVSYTQTNDFKIGMFAYRYQNVNGLPPTTLTINGNNLSQLNVLSEDGFNIVTRYSPDFWTSPQSMMNLIQLGALNGIQLMTNTKDWYQANSNNPGTAFHSDGTPYLHSTQPGINDYNATYGFPDFDFFFDNVYNQSNYKSHVWGHQICEEAALWNLHKFTNTFPSGWGGPSEFIETEIPLDNVLDAIEHFTIKKNQNEISDQRLEVMEAHHSQGISQNLTYDGENNDFNNHYTARHLIDALPENTVFLEGSYSRFPPH